MTEIGEECKNLGSKGMKDTKKGLRIMGGEEGGEGGMTHDTHTHTDGRMTTQEDMDYLRTNHS